MLLFLSSLSSYDLLLFYLIPQTLQVLFLPPLLCFWNKGRKDAVYLHSYQDRLPGNYLLEPVSLITNVQASTIVDTFSKRNTHCRITFWVIIAGLMDGTMYPATKASQHFGQMCSHFCLTESFQFLPAALEKKQALCRQGEKSLVPSTCARAQSALYLSKFANKGCYCDSWTKGAIKISKTLAPFPASWVASWSPGYLGTIPAPSWLCPPPRQGQAAWQPGVGVQHFLPSWSH